LITSKQGSLRENANIRGKFVVLSLMINQVIVPATLLVCIIFCMLQSLAPIFQNYMGFPTDNQFHIGSFFIRLIALCSVCSFSALIPFIAHLIGGSYLARIPLCTLFIFTFRSILHHLFPVFTF